MDSKDRLSRIAPLCGALFVVLQLAGVAISSAGGRSMATISDSKSKIVDSFSHQISAGYWAGAYLEFASVAAFALFAVWMFRERRGPLATAGLLTAAVYVAITIAALVVGDAIAYGSGHGLATQPLLALFYLQCGLFFATWGIAAAFLVLAPAAGWMRRTAIVTAALLVLALALPQGGPSQFPNMLFLIWTLAASISMMRRPAGSPSRVPAGATAT